MDRRSLFACIATIAASLAGAGSAQMPDMAAAARWEKAGIVHYEVVGEIALKGHQIPAADADLYADVTDRVRLSFDWDRKKGVIVGKPTIVNETGTAANLAGVDKGEKGKKRCPTGRINGTYEHFDVVEVRQPQGPRTALELVGKRIHPETQVAEACGKGLDLHADGEVGKARSRAGALNLATAGARSRAPTRAVPARARRPARPRTRKAAIAPGR